MSMSRREKLEAMLQQEPHDPFLNYALAADDISRGDSKAGADRLQALLERNPEYVAAYFQQAQALAKLAELSQAREVLARGIRVAEQVGDSHAAGEMAGFLESLPPS